MERIRPALQRLDERLRDALIFASGNVEYRRDAEARALWHQEYQQLADERVGLLGAITSRAEAQTMRLALIYALLDRSESITVAHLQAALALWRYAEASAAYVFGTALGDPVADDVLKRIRAAGDAGIAQTDLTLAYGRHGTANLNRALGRLQELGLIEAVQRETGGRPATYWRAIGDGVTSAKSVQSNGPKPAA